MSDFDNTLVKMGQVAQMLKALSEKGWGRRELTLMGQATPVQLEDVRAILQGRARIVPVVKPWWREGDDIVIPYPTEDRSGSELLAQDPDRFGIILCSEVQAILPKVGRMTGKGELVLIKSQAWGKSYHEVLTKLLSERPDLELAPPETVAQIGNKLVEEIGHEFFIMTQPFLYEFTPRHKDIVVFQWQIVNQKATLWGKYATHSTKDPNPWLPSAAFAERFFLLQRKTSQP